MNTQELCNTCHNIHTNLSLPDIARNIQHFGFLVEVDLATLEGLNKVTLTPAIAIVAENLNQRVFENLLRVKEFTDTLFNDNFSL